MVDVVDDRSKRLESNDLKEINGDIQGFFHGDLDFGELNGLDSELTVDRRALGHGGCRDIADLDEERPEEFRHFVS